MSEEILSDYIDQHAAHGDKAIPPSDPETQKLVGTVRLAHSALSSPAPPAGAEDQSRAKALSKLDSIRVSPGGLPKAPNLHGHSSFLENVISRIKRFLKR